METQKKYKHVRWIDLYGNGIAKEILVFKEDESNGDICFIPVDSLDNIDKDRVVSMLRHRDAQNYPLWEVMANTTLKNGQNALLFFHQLVKVRTVAGQIVAPGRGHGLTQRPMSISQHLNEVTSAEETAQPEKRGAGRPPKKTFE